jgi:hypothetical protein
VETGVVLHCEFSEEAGESDIYIWVASFCEDSAVCCAAQLTCWIGFRDTQALEFQNIEFVEKSEPFEPKSDHSFPEFELFRSTVACSVHHNLGLVACTIEYG